jgi:3-oxoacyl-[acyl-carrier protein] reductase
MIDPRLRGRGVLVTGANNPLGIGAAIATAFAALGARLFLHYHRTVEAFGTGVYRAQQRKSCGEVVKTVTALGATADAFEADFTDVTAIPRLFDRAENTVGPIDVLVNNAATWRPDTFVPGDRAGRNPFLELFSDAAEPISDSSSMPHFVANAVAPALLMREFARRLVARGETWGRIINISTAGADGFPSEVSYGASKYALESFTRAAAHELGQFGITVNVLALGPVQTGWITPALEEAIRPTIPLGRIGTPTDVADVVVFLASEQARWVTGQKIMVSGGHRM